MDWQAARVSLTLAVMTAALLLPTCLWLARWLATTRSSAKPWVQAMILLPLLLPPTVIGFYFLTSLGPASRLGAWLVAHFDLRLVFSFEGLLLASVLVNIPFMVQPMERAFSALAPSMREAAWIGGLSPWRTFCRIELPLAWPGVLAGVAMTVAHTLGEFGVVLMVGGSIPGDTKTLSVAIYDRVQSFDDVGAHQMALALVVCSMAALIAVFASDRRGHKL